MDSDREGLATSFGREAGSYERGRPDYPVEAVVWMLEGVAESGTVVDIGAGTGKLTRVVAATGREVIGIDPDPEMLAKLSEQNPNIAVYPGTAESLPLPDASADAVVGGQMWHWVDPVTASAEAARVLRPGGTIGLIWNIRDETTPWVRRISGIMKNSAAEKLIADDGVVIGDPFGPVEEATFEWVRVMSATDLLEMARSRSYVITADVDTRLRIESELAELFTSLPGLSDRGIIDLPYTTHVYRARIS